MIDEKAKWIAAENKKLEAPLFRKLFFLPGEPEHAELSVCGLGYGVVTLNGRPVTQDVLTTPFTKFDATVLFCTYDVTALLRKGENAAGVMLGNGWYHDIAKTWDLDTASWRHHVKFIFSLSITMKTGETLQILSDSTWKSHAGPIVFNHIRCGERYDARLHENGFDTPGYDERDWQKTFVCRGPGGVLKQAELPPIRVVKTLEMDRIFPRVFDAHQNLSGWVRIRVKAKRGQKITIKYAERISSHGQLETDDMNQYNFSEMKHCDAYICAGTGGWETWEPHFCYHGFRYVEVSGEPEDFAIAACVVHTDLASVGRFECGDEMLNRIHRAVRWSTLCNYHGMPTDCPHREQNGWTGDALLSSEQTLMNFEMTAAYHKWLADFRDAQRPNGQIPGIIPTGGWGYNWGSGPAWDSALILIPLYLWRYTKDRQILAEMWDCMERYLDFLATMEEGGMVDFGLGDWCPPNQAAVCPTALTDTAYYYADALAMMEMAQALKKDSLKYQTLARQIRKAFRKKFIKNGLPVVEGQTALACVLYQGLLEPEERELAAKRLAALVAQNGFHIDCGILGTKYIFRALSDYGYDEVLYRMVTNPTAPSYAFWIHCGMTTLCENWDMKNSLNHHMFSEVDLWFYRSLAGIRRDEKRLIIAPSFLKEVDWVRAVYREISVYWDQEKITVCVPEPATLQMGQKNIPLSPGKTTILR